MGTRPGRAVTQYQDVPSVDDEYESEEDVPPSRRKPYATVPRHDDSDLDEEVPRRKRPALRRASPTRSSCVSCCVNLWCILSLVVILAAVGLGLAYWKLDWRPPELPWLPPLPFYDNDNGILNDTSDPGSVDFPGPGTTVHYDPNAALHAYNPFDLQEPSNYGSVLAPPRLDADEHDSTPLGYMMQPSIVNNNLVFVSEGDMYLAKLDAPPFQTYMSAMKLTTTVGNVRTPIPNPVFPYYIAYTATYTGRREIYLMDLRPTKRQLPALRLTYWDSPYGISSIVGWKDDGKTLLFAAMSIEVGLPDMRLYQISLVQEQGDELRVLQIQPIPLTQAIDGVYDPTNTCLYFTRFSQSSRTIRYVGGTAESLWAYCNSQDQAVALTHDYRGTSKAPQILQLDGRSYLLFLSDRFRNSRGEWIPSSMNLWATYLPSESDLHDRRISTNFYPLTSVSCEFNGMSLTEYSLDVTTGNVVLRIGADLHFLSVDVIRQKLGLGGRNLQEGNEAIDQAFVSSSPTIQRLPIVVYSDFHEIQERLVPVTVPEAVTSIDAYETAYGSTAALVGLRGQLFVVPVMADVGNMHPYVGAGMNMPPRRYRVAPGTTTGGSIRILACSHVPLPLEEGKTARRLAVILATDPKSQTAEHAFYLIETTTSSAPSFVDLADLPNPFIGGHINGGSVLEGGLGSVDPSSIAVSPCGRRLAWTDTDGRICIMTLPMYQSSEIPSYKVLPQQNEQGEPVVGTEADLLWSPGGRYLAITHSARNQFRIISIADCGNPEPNEPEYVADVAIARVVQATPDRFNSGSAYWGKTALDYKLEYQSGLLAKLMELPEPSPRGASTLFFLSDRDVITDVSSPWGTRGPSPHFPALFSVFALPLVGDEDEQGLLNPSRGTFAGGGVSELWVDKMLALEKVLETMIPDKSERRKLVQSSPHAIGTTSSPRRRLQDENINGEIPTTQSPTAVPSSQFYQAPDPFLTTNSSTNSPTLAPSVTYATVLPGDPQAFPTEPDPSVATSMPTTSPSLRTTNEPSKSPTLAPTATPQTSSPTQSPSASQSKASPFPKDGEIVFGPTQDLSFARRAYRLGNIPPGAYSSIISQALDDPSLVLTVQSDTAATIWIFAIDEFPSDTTEPQTLDFSANPLKGIALSTTREHLIVMLTGGKTKVVTNTALGLVSLIKDEKLTKNIADTDNMAVSIWPALEYQQMYNDAWRLLRDYFYDTNMNGVDWRQVHERYKPLVKRCTKREELDDVLQQMAAELSALHVFVYGGEYANPLYGNIALGHLQEIASLGATMDRSAEWKGYMITSIPERDPDFNVMDNNAIFSPLSDRALNLTGQVGLQVGDVIVGINGESVMRVPDIHMLLRGMAGRSIRLDVLRLASGNKDVLDDTSGEDKGVVPEPLITVPLSPEDGVELRYRAWEWKTRQKAVELAAASGFSVGYIHLKSMTGPQDADAFFRGFYPDYDKQALIIDVRHNRGGNIDSWLLDVLQRKAWMYWQGRATNIRNGGLGWDEQFAFRGHLVVLIDEHTSSDGEGFSRGVSELGLGKLVGTRTWGGGIWLSSDNTLVDGGIATAPEIGTYNDKFGWGLGIEQVGVQPDIEMDNNPRLFYDGQDEQLARGIEVLRQWLDNEPIVMPNEPGLKRDMSLPEEARNCPAT